MEREEFITATEIAFEKLMNPTRGLRPALLEEPMSEGKWSFKDMAAHLAFWNTVRIRALESANNDEEFDWSPYNGLADKWNSQTIEENKNAPLKRVLNELRLTHSTLVEAFRRVPDEKLAHYPVTRGKIMEAPDHYLHHLPDVEAWAARVRLPAK